MVEFADNKDELNTLDVKELAESMTSSSSLLKSLTLFKTPFVSFGVEIFEWPPAPWPFAVWASSCFRKHSSSS